MLSHHFKTLFTYLFVRLDFPYEIHLKSADITAPPVGPEMVVGQDGAFEKVVVHKGGERTFRIVETSCGKLRGTPLVFYLQSYYLQCWAKRMHFLEKTMQPFF